MTEPAEGFDRLRRRAEPGRDPGRRPDVHQRAVDPQGRQALYSAGAQPPHAPGAVTVECSSCGEKSAVTPRQLLALAFPSLHLPLIRRGHPSWMRCPACHRRTWVRLALTL